MNSLEKRLQIQYADAIAERDVEIGRLENENISLKEQLDKAKYRLERAEELLEAATDIICPGNYENCIWKDFCSGAKEGICKDEDI